MTNNPQIYEKVVKRRDDTERIVAKICAVVGYVCFDLAWIWGIVASSFNLGVIALSVIFTVVLINLTWKLFMLEYEYSFVGGEFSAAKIYAKQRRKTIVCADISDALLIAPANEENLASLERHEIEKTAYAVSTLQAENIWFALFSVKEGKSKVCVYFEADEKMINLFRQYNARATSREKLSNSQSGQ